MNDKRDQHIQDQLHAAWDEVDKWGNQMGTPSQSYMTLLLKQQKAKMKRRLWRELCCLWLFAAVLISGGYWLVEQSAEAFFILQAVLLLVGCAAAVWTSIVLPSRKRRESR